MFGLIASRRGLVGIVIATKQPCGLARSRLGRPVQQTAENGFDHCVEVGLVQRTVSIDIPAAWPGFSRRQ